jgi:hypothetical protein
MHDDGLVEMIIDAFFQSYLGAFERADIPALSEHLAYPCHVAGDSGEVTLTAIASVSDYIDAVAPLFRAYDALGVARGRIRRSSTFALSEDLVQVTVYWDVLDGSDGMIYDHEAVYTLVRREAAWKISAIAYNELSRVRACLAARRTETQPSS